MDPIVELAQKLSGLSLAALLLIILWGSWRRYWRWGRDVDDIEIRCRAEKQILVNDRDWWRDVALRATGLLERQGVVIREKEVEVANKIDELNRKLLGGNP